MDVHEILQELDRNQGYFPRLVVEEAIARREEIVPELLRILDEAVRNPYPLAEDGNRMAHLYACYLLAQFREPRLYPLLLRLFSLPDDLPEHLLDDSLTMDGSRMLASVCEGDMSGMATLVENENANL